MRYLFPLCLMLLILSLCGCGARTPLPPEAEQPKTSGGLRYDVAFESPEGTGGLVAEMKENSQLLWLRSDVPDTRVGLERRVLEDVDTAIKILHSNGYYDGKVRHRINWEDSPVTVRLNFVPGQQYAIGVTKIRYERSSLRWKVAADSETARFGKNFMASAPETLESFGLKPGSPARAKAVLGAVSAVFAQMRREGYPLAEQGRTRYVIDRSTHTLDAEVEVRTGPLLRMGPVQTHEEGVVRDEIPPVNGDYLNLLTPWIEGQYWNDDLIRAYRTTLQETGLFSSIDMEPARLPVSGQGVFKTEQDMSEEASGSLGEIRDNGQAGEQQTEGNGRAESKADPAASAPGKASGRQGPLWMTTKGTTPIALTVRNAPPRTVSGGMAFSTDTGFGVRGAWENRNLFGGGEQLRITAPISQTSQSLSASFRKPAFGIRDQSLVGEAWAIKEKTDAYDQSAMSVAGGLERRFRKDWRNWWASARVSLEAGRLDDNLRGGRTYTLVGVPLAVRRDTTNDLLNPTEGTRISLEVTPYTGTFMGPLTTIRTRFDASGYYSPFESGHLVLAARAVAGSLTGESVENIPASLRFYTGGGGSVRGYKYQSLGPKDRRGDPLGGLSFTDVNLEARIRITEQFGIVPFVDGGMVYESSMPDWGRDLAWGVGLGFRYFTPIGPVRLDIATPLQDRDSNKAFQLYLSIGQAF